MEEIDYLKEALEIEKEALENTEKCFEYYVKAGNREMMSAMKEIKGDEESHIEEIETLIEKMKE